MRGANLEIVETDDDKAILPLLEGDRAWGAYALCDLEPPYRANARYVAALRDRRPSGVMLLYRLLGFSVLTFCGDDASDILAGARDLPHAAFLMARHSDMDAVERRYRVDDAWEMRRMVVTATGLRPPPAVDADVAPLGRADLPALQALYDGETHFAPAMLADGVFFGARADGRLVAAAGTHAIARRRGVGIIGNVFTHPEYRGRGLARATTGAVASALARLCVRDVALNVRADNAPAIAVYTRLGFHAHCPFYEGHATLKDA